MNKNKSNETEPVATVACTDLLGDISKATLLWCLHCALKEIQLWEREKKMEARGTISGDQRTARRWVTKNSRRKSEIQKLIKRLAPNETGQAGRAKEREA
jgi:hypothetical protein